jgi:hypothetical protein
MFDQLRQQIAEREARLAEQRQAIDQAEAAFARLQAVLGPPARDDAGPPASRVPGKARARPAASAALEEVLTCHHCHGEFARPSPQGPRPKHCSPACVKAARAEAEDARYRELTAEVVKQTAAEREQGQAAAKAEADPVHQNGADGEPAAEALTAAEAVTNGGSTGATNGAAERRCAFCNDVLPAGAHADQRYCGRTCKEAERAARKDQRRAMPWSGDAPA